VAAPRARYSERPSRDHRTLAHSIDLAAFTGSRRRRRDRDRNECLVGFTRLGNLLGLLDRQDIPEYPAHRVWLGSAIRRP
jgi:hypothetical protein